MSTNEVTHGIDKGSIEKDLRLNATESSAEAPRGMHHPARARRFMPSYMSWILATSLVLAGIIASLLLLNQKPRVTTAEQTGPGTQGSADLGTLKPDQQSDIAVEVVQRTNLQVDVTAPGKVTFNGNRVTPVFSQFGGRLVKLTAEVGSLVRSHQTLGIIDSPDIVGLQSDYLQALTAERSARTTFDLTRRTRERTERLAAVEALPQRDLQQAKVDESHAADDLQRTEAAVVGTRGRLQSAGMSETEINRLTPGSKAVNRLVNLVAPIAGTITEKKAGAGQVVQAGAGDPLFMIADLSTVWVNADIYEDQLAHLHTGTPVKIKTPAYPNETFAARIDQIGSTLDPDKHTVPVRCVVPNRGGRLKPGMFASVILVSGRPQTVIAIPMSAVINEGEQRSVFVEQSRGQYAKRAVETGDEVNGSLVIHAGLKEGDRVVVRGGLLMSAGPKQ